MSPKKKSRVLLVHWNVDEAAERVERLRKAGYEATPHSDKDGTSFRAIREAPPDAFVIDLSRVPSQGRDLGIWLRQQKPTRAIPLVFVGGDPEKVARARSFLPDATYTEWSRIRSALRAALQKAQSASPSDLAVPNVMQGYSGTPLPKKLRIKEGSRVALLGAPEDFENTLGDLPAGVSIRRQARGQNDIVMLFAKSRADMERRFATAEKAMAEGGGMWIAWRKKSSGVSTDLTQTDVRRYGLDSGLVDYKIAAIDETWSGLIFARRK
jgi:CheY-like chemotaxis protein